MGANGSSPASIACICSSPVLPAHWSGAATPGPARIIRASLASPSAIHCCRTAWASSADRRAGAGADMASFRWRLIDALQRL